MSMSYSRSLLLAGILLAVVGPSPSNSSTTRATEIDLGNSTELSSSHKKCHIDHSQPPNVEELVRCANSSMFEVWRPKARLIAPRGWMNDPMGIFETKNGTFHIGYQCNPNALVVSLKNLPHVRTITDRPEQWSNISQCSASTTDFVHFNDYHSWKNPVTIAPSQLYDIRGVFDGTVIQNGWGGHPTLIYTSVFTGPISAVSDPPEIEGVETQSLAYTPDEGNTWIKLNFGAKGNPVIYKWPEQHLSGFRDPFVFESQELLQFYSNKTISHQIAGDPKAPKPVGKKFLLLSGGIRTEIDPVHGGPRLFLYQQTDEHDVREWTYLGPLMSYVAERNQTTEWGGANGINFECGAITKIDEEGLAVNQVDTKSSSTQLNVVTVGSEGGRPHRSYWPIWKAVSWDLTAPDGNVKAKADFSGVIDWGTAYAFHLFQSKKRQLIVGWIYEDDPLNVLTPQRGAQGAFTLFREMFVKIVRNIHPAELAAPIHLPSWTTKSDSDGSQHLVTVGQRILPEITSAFRSKSSIHQLPDRLMNPGGSANSTDGTLSSNIIPFQKQPRDRYYAISARLDFHAHGKPGNNQPFDRSAMPAGGLRILASDNEWTDVYYDPSEEYLVVNRSQSSAISSYGNSTERAKLRLWSILDPVTRETRMESLNLTIVVDNSVVEVHANERAIISTRVYPWYKSSTGVAYIVRGRPTIVEYVHPARNPPFSASSGRVNTPEYVHSTPLSVAFSNVELWDGLLNAWPNRPRNTSLPGVYSHNITSSLYGLWPDL